MCSRSRNMSTDAAAHVRTRVVASDAVSPSGTVIPPMPVPLGSAPRLQRIGNPSSTSFARCLEILHESMSQGVQLENDRLMSLLRRNDYRLYGLFVDNAVAAMAIVYLSEAQQFAWLDYMAVCSERRGQGLGSDLFRGLLRLLPKDQPTARHLILEVGDSLIDFYRRLGAKLLVNVDYLFPSPSGPALPMRLMVCGLRDDVSVSQATVKAAIEEVFRTIHGRTATDPLLRSIVNSVPPEIVVQ